MRWLFSFLTCLVALFLLQVSSAALFNGTVYDIDGNALNNSLVNVTVRDTSFSVVGFNTTTTNASGWFNMTLLDNPSWFYEVSLTYENESWNYTQWVGQSLPAFPPEMMGELAGTEFYLREAGTINITAVNITGGDTSFRYQVKDTKLGYPIAEGFETNVSSISVVVPKDRNYSIMIYPDMSMPVSFNWNNFSAASSYSYADGLSNYNRTTSILSKRFNITMGWGRAHGYTNTSRVSGFSAWDEFTVVPFMVEPGDMVHVDYGDMPYNLSAFFQPGSPDVHNLTSGFYNISLPSTVEASEILLFATARNGSNYYGGVANLSLAYATYTGGQDHPQLNFSMYSLVGSAGNISLETVTGSTINISTAKQNFSFINSTGSYIENSFAHVEATLDYSSYGAKEFTWMVDIEQGESSTFFIPLLNVTGVEEMNVYVSGGNFEPVRKEYNVTDIVDPQNVTVGSFNPADIDGGDISSNLKIALFSSNSTCDVPSPGDACVIGSTDSISGEDFSSFDPLKAVMGGGRISFRMGLFSTGIIVHYVNVDMLASGPPSALFDDSASESTDGGFESALRFGSSGPTIYDYVLISMPYTEGSDSTTGIDESSEVNLSIPILYDDSWNIIWNTTQNGTNGTLLSGNYSHYTTYKDDWETLMGGVSCTTNVSIFNATNPCYINTTADRVWIRLPHFSGTGPTLSGSVITATESGTNDGSSGGSSSSTKLWSITYVDESAAFDTGYTRKLSKGQRIRVPIGSETHHVGITEVTTTSATLNISSDPVLVTLGVGEDAKVDATGDDYYDLHVTLQSIVNSQADVLIQTIRELVVETDSGVNDSLDGITGDVTDGSDSGAAQEPAGGEGKRRSFWIFGVAVLLIVLVGAGVVLEKKYNKLFTR